jgi:hypothetical protein
LILRGSGDGSVACYLFIYLTTLSLDQITMPEMVGLLVGNELQKMWLEVILP